MQITVILAFVVVLSFGAGAVSPAHPAALFSGVAVYWAGAAAVAWALTRGALRRLERAGDSIADVSRRYQRWQILPRIYLVGGFAALMVCGLGERLGRVPGAGVIVLMDEALAIGVFFVALLIHWRLNYPFDQAVRQHLEQELLLAGQPVRAGWSAREHMEFHIRHHFAFVAVPMALMVAAWDALSIIDTRIAPGALSDEARVAAMAVAVAGVFFFAPVLLVRVWRSRPMEDGELRRRIERLCEKINLRYRQLRIWDTGGVLVNAGVMGLHRSVRYILISDAMLENMDDRQIVAVFGHEAGHVKHHHILYFLVFTKLAMLTCLAVTAGVLMLTPDGPWKAVVELILSALLVAGVWGVGFGWLSRRFERQADVYGSWCAAVDGRINGGREPTSHELEDGTPTFVAALENVGRLNGAPREMPNWRHGSIAARVDFLIRWVHRGGSRIAFDRTVHRVKVALWLGLLAAIALAAATYPAWL